MLCDVMGEMVVKRVASEARCCEESKEEWYGAARLSLPSER